MVDLVRFGIVEGMVKAKSIPYSEHQSHTLETLVLFAQRTLGVVLGHDGLGIKGVTLPI